MPNPWFYFPFKTYINREFIIKIKNSEKFHVIKIFIFDEPKLVFISFPIATRLNRNMILLLKAFCYFVIPLKYRLLDILDAFEIEMNQNF